MLQYNFYVSFILYIIGIIWLLVLPSKIVHNTSKTQENALLAGQVIIID